MFFGLVQFKGLDKIHFKLMYLKFPHIFAFSCSYNQPQKMRVTQFLINRNLGGG